VPGLRPVVPAIQPIFARYEAEHPGQVKLVLKDYPLNRDCNDALGQTFTRGL
jgi:hypothetical protein